MLTISTFSLILLKSVSRAMNTDYFKTQLVVTVAGLLAALVLSFIDYESIASFWYLIAGFSVFIMLYTMLFGISVQGSEGVNARAWISLAGRTFQTSELVKICFMLTYAKHISVLRVQNKINHPLHVVLLALHAAVPVLLCHVQGDDGAAIVFFFMFLCMSLGGGVQLRYFILLGALVAVSVPVLWKFVLSEYQIKRFTSVYNLDDPSIQLNEGYQQVQGRISIGSGQLTGKGLFNGPRVETNLVTFQHSDF
ncbi:FtsW/RodA/SpoVE family cell cycle protein, partial [Hominenteromicrobium sp.]